MAKAIEFTQDQIDQIISLHNEGKLNREIAEMFNVSRMTIGRVLKSYNVPSRHPLLTDERKQLAVEYYEQYHNLSAVEKMLHMNAKTVKNILQERNIYVHSMAEAKKKCTINEDYFATIDSHRKAYFLGLLYADGTVSGKTNRVQLSLQEQDKDIIYCFREELQSNYKISLLRYNDKNPNWSNQYCLTITNTKIHDDLVSHGVIPNKSLTLSFPTTLDEKYYNSFILGYLDGDGHIGKKEKRISIISTESFCKSVAEIVNQKLGVRCSIMLCHHNDKVSTRTLQIAGKRQVKRFLDWLYSDCDIFLSRKHDVYLNLYCA